jgi:hypothetical protein
MPSSERASSGSRSKQPALLIGMDAIGLLDVFIIDYRRHELQLRTRVDRQGMPR